MFQIERAIVREITDLWCKDKSYFNENFAEYVDAEFKGKRIKVIFTNKGRMKCGSPEATVNEMMRGLILTMATDQKTGKLLKNHEAIIGNILDVFVHRVKEIGERKFILQRLQSLELGFSVAFGLDKEFYPIRKDRRLLEDLVTVASLTTADETAEALIQNIHETEALVAKERGVTFHIFMATQKEASFISLPLGSDQTNYVPLLGTHTLRCNILAQPEGHDAIRTGILKIDAPTQPRNFIAHKGFELDIDEPSMMAKLRSTAKLQVKDFSNTELAFLKLLFNEYVQLAFFLMSSKRIDPNLRLLIIFPRVNIFMILRELNAAIPVEEPQRLGDLAALHKMLFKIKKQSASKSKKKTYRIPERVIQQKVVEAIQAIARDVLINVYKPLANIKQIFLTFRTEDFSDSGKLVSIHRRVEEISAYLKKLQRIHQVVLDEHSEGIDLEASLAVASGEQPLDALEEIVKNIQAAEIDQTKEVIVSKMLDYLSFVTVRLEQFEKVSSLYIKQEIIKELESSTSMILLQAKSYYNLVMGRPEKRRS